APTRAGVRNSDVFQNLAVRWKELRLVLDGTAPTLSAGSVPPHSTGTAVFLTSFVLLAGLSLFAGGQRPSKACRAILTIEAALFLLTALTPKTLSVQHLLVLWPYPALIVALAA